MQSFADRVYRIVAKIPRGEVLTYKQVASLAGSPNASRAVGSILKKNWNPDVPCHRVVRSDGRAGEYNRGADQKKEILHREGVKKVLR